MLSYDSLKIDLLLTSIVYVNFLSLSWHPLKFNYNTIVSHNMLKVNTLFDSLLKEHIYVEELTYLSCF